ncbi:MAG: heavy metal-binding domain-containing protein [Acidobacteria bacterium]|nr:heavy metal-binding domain-containing protein [Acidobacteriota bacterium]
MSTETPIPDGSTLRADVRLAMASLENPSTSHTSVASVTSDLSIDEELNLHAVGWQPVELVSGVSAFSVPSGLWNWGQGEIVGAIRAHENAFSHAILQLQRDAAQAGGHGVVGVRVERAVHPTHVEVSLVGTAVRPIGASAVDSLKVFTSDLSGRDFALLDAAGWQPLGLAHGASFVYAPRRQMSTVLAQQSQNVELTNFTNAIYEARETAMERLQAIALSLAGTGIVQVQVVEGPMSFASHAIGFATWGTVVRLTREAHQRVEPQMVMSMNDRASAFEATTLG